MTLDHDLPGSSTPVPDAITQLIAQWVELFNAGDLAALDLLYEPDAVVVPTPGHAVSEAGRSAALAHLVSFGVPMTANIRQCYTVVNIALLLVDWTMRGTAADGRPVDMSGTATDVVRRGFDGQWRYVIDNPSGN
ncbi:YybH family protein [Nocardia goodfellowii]